MQENVHCHNFYGLLFLLSDLNLNFSKNDLNYLQNGTSNKFQTKKKINKISMAK